MNLKIKIITIISIWANNGKFGADSNSLGTLIASAKAYPKDKLPINILAF